MAKVTGDIQGVFDTDLGKLVGVVPVGTTDVSYLFSSSAALTASQVPAGVADASAQTAVANMSSGLSAAPATLDATTGAAANGGTRSLAAGATMTVSDAAWAAIPAGLVIQVGQSGSATLAFSGTAVKENASGTSATSVTLAASGVYTLTQSPSGSPKFRLSGGASL